MEEGKRGTKSPHVRNMYCLSKEPHQCGERWEMGSTRELVPDPKGTCGRDSGFGWGDVCGFGDGS